MTNEGDRRHTDSEAARRRRREQQQEWEQSHAHLDRDHISEAFTQALGALVNAARALPVCNRSARLHAGIARVAKAVDKPAACAAARALLLASELALEEDPWFSFHRAASETVAALCKAA